MTGHILYSFRRCPYAIRARMTLAYAAIECELRELMLKDKPPSMLQYSPKGTVPVLVTGEGQVIDESLAVMLWALQQKDPNNWRKDQNHGLELIHLNDHEFKPLLDRYKYADRHPELTEIQHRDLTIPFIESLDNRLQKAQFLINSQISLADVALFPFIRQYAFVDKPWFDQLPYSALKKWLQNFLEADLFIQIMPKFKLFNDGFRYQFPTGQLISDGYPVD